MILEVLTSPNPALREVAVEVTDTADVADLAYDLLLTADKLRSRGLAATQVGRAVRVIVWQDGSEYRVAINPVVIKTRGLKAEWEECLSLPGTTALVERPEIITLAASDAAGNRFTVKRHGREARAIQHEIDHLDGILITDKALETRTILRRPERPNPGRAGKPNGAQPTRPTRPNPVRATAQ